MEKHHSENRVRALYEIIDKPVKNAAKEHLGKISEIMLDKNSGQTAYVVLSCNGFLGMGEKLFALPWKDLHYNKEDECFITDIEKETLKSKPGFDKDHWPDMPSESLH